MLGGEVGQCDQAICIRLLIGASQIEVPILPQRLEDGALSVLLRTFQRDAPRSLRKILLGFRR